MNVFKYIAVCNPALANEVTQSRGLPYSTNSDEVAYFLQCIVADEGENGLRAVMEVHPDKDTTIELFAPKPEIVTEKEIIEKPVFVSATGEPKNEIKVASAQKTNLYVIAGALLISLAILSIK
jgi:hypothetical protein